MSLQIQNVVYGVYDLNQIALSIDIEDWYHSRHVSSLEFNPNRKIIDFKNKYNRNYKYLEKPISDILNLLKRYQVKATFFIVADLIEDNKDIFQEIVRQGHEIACHGLHHIEYKGSGDSEEVKLFRNNILKSMDMLRNFSNQEILGFRAPSAFFRNWMIDILLDLGIRYDSSISVNSIYQKQPEYNTKNMTTKPILLKNKLLEIPWPYLNIMGFKLPSGGGPLLRYLPKTVICKALEQSIKKSDTVFYFHPLDVSDENLPEIIMKNREKYWYNKGSKCLNKVEFLLNKLDGRFTTCREIYFKNKGMNYS